MKGNDVTYDDTTETLRFKHKVPKLLCILTGGHDITKFDNTQVFYTQSVRKSDRNPDGKDKFLSLTWKGWNIFVETSSDSGKPCITMKPCSPRSTLPAKTMPCKNTRFVSTLNVPKVPESRSPSSKTTACFPATDQCKIRRRTPKNIEQPTGSAKSTTNEISLESPMADAKSETIPPRKDKPFHGNPSKEKHPAQEYLGGLLFAILDMDRQGLTPNSKSMDNVSEKSTGTWKQCINELLRVL